MINAILESNIKALEKNYKYILDFFSENEFNEDVTAFFRNDANGYKKLFAKKGEDYFQLDSLKDSATVTDMWFENLMDDSIYNQKLLMFGFGNGMFVDRFLKGAKDDSMIVVYEPTCSILYSVLCNVDVSQLFLDKRLILVFAPALQELFVSQMYSRIIEYKDVYSFKQVVYPNYQVLFTEQYSEYCDGVKVAFDDHIMATNFYVKYGCQIDDNIYHNFKYLINSKSLEMFGQYYPEDVPIIIISAGPSLEKNMHEIENAKGKALIISCDTALKPLIRSGIKPDLWFNVDPAKGYGYMDGVGVENIPLVCSIRSKTDLMDAHIGQKYFFRTADVFFNQYLDDNNIIIKDIPCAGSVSCAAFSLAHRIGCKNIIMIGQDLAYTGEKVYPDGTEHENVGDIKYEAPLVVEDIYGQPVKTTAEMNSFRNWFEKEISNLGEEYHIIDATEGGAKINGTQIMTLRDAINKYCIYEFEPCTFFEKMPNLLSAKQISEYAKYMCGLNESILECLSMVKEGREIYEELLTLARKDLKDWQAFKLLLDNGNSISKKIEDSKIYDMILHKTAHADRKVHRTIYKTELNENDDIINVCEMGVERYCDYENALEEMIERIKPYMAEYKNYTAE